ncbi:MAG: hypothetical protein COS89_08935 [Deltaproteobacteria bacterium CG07_land_8_20_14_0_80_38_7]|nr:MAG: hypothetical protein COS89_08935 [Deltaproteobacteria bacterium CG07_land_8_20_14_0_80_38_7]
MQKRGLTASGSQRWYCSQCKKSSTPKRSDLTIKYRKALFVDWLIGTKTLSDYAKSSILLRLKFLFL